MREASVLISGLFVAVVLCGSSSFLEFQCVSRWLSLKLRKVSGQPVKPVVAGEPVNPVG